MSEFIFCPDLTSADEYVLDNLDRKRLAEWIDFLRSYRETLWRDNDMGDIVPLKELRKRKSSMQALPVYPSRLKEMGEFFRNMMLKERPEYMADFYKTGLFTKESKATLYTGTLWSPALIASLISDAYHRERFFTGLFGRGVDNGLYLKALLHLEDIADMHQWLKNAEQG